MSTLCNTGLGSSRPPHPVISLEYKSICATAPLAAASDESEAAPESSQPAIAVPTVSLTEQELQARLQQARAEGAAQAQQQLGAQLQAAITQERANVAAAVAKFQKERSDYYSRIESEVVQLALGIAAKILHREAQVDRALMPALVRIAIENLQQRTNVAVRVRPREGERWRAYFAQNLPDVKVDVIEDSQIGDQSCILETELGTADVGVDAQLKEIERGFFDLLAQRPDRQ